IVARKGKPVRLCAALAGGQSGQPSCDGAWLELTDGVLWRLPNNQAVFGGVLHGILTDSLDDPENPSDAKPCTFGPSSGPCAGFPYVRSAESLIWSDHEYSVAGTVDDHRLVELRELSP